MTTNFFVALLIVLSLPPVVSRVFRIQNIFPLVFLQLMIGVFLNVIGAATPLEFINLDLKSGFLLTASIPSLLGNKARILILSMAVGLCLSVALFERFIAHKDNVDQKWRTQL